MAEFAEGRDFRSVTLVDRAGTGGAEIIFDGVRIVFPRGVTEKAVPVFVAEWLFRVTQQHVWTTDGQYICRFGLKDAPEDILALAGPEAQDCSPIQLADRVEGWDTSGVDRSNTRTVALNIPRSLTHERQGSLAGSFGERKE